MISDDFELRGATKVVLPMLEAYDQSEKLKFSGEVVAL